MDRTKKVLAALLAMVLMFGSFGVMATEEEKGTEPQEAAVTIEEDVTVKPAAQGAGESAPTVQAEPEAPKAEEAPAVAQEPAGPAEEDPAEPTPEPVISEIGEPVEPAEPAPVKREVRVECVMNGVTLDGDELRLKAKLVGFEENQVGLQWQYNRDDGEGWQDAQDLENGAQSLTYRLKVNEENLNRKWRIVVTVVA